MIFFIFILVVADNVLNVCFSVHDLVTICDDPYTAAEGTYAIVVCTEWDEFMVSTDFINLFTF